MDNEERGSFTVPQIGEMLHVRKVTAYEISKDPVLDRKMILGQYRILKRNFWKWYENQTKYRVYETPFDPEEYILRQET